MNHIKQWYSVTIRKYVCIYIYTCYKQKTIIILFPDNPPRAYLSRKHHLQFLHPASGHPCHYLMPQILPTCPDGHHPIPWSAAPQIAPAICLSQQVGISEKRICWPRFTTYPNFWRGSIKIGHPRNQPMFRAPNLSTKKKERYKPTNHFFANINKFIRPQNQWMVPATFISHGLRTSGSIFRKLGVASIAGFQRPNSWQKNPKFSKVSMTSRCPIFV